MTTDTARNATLADLVALLEGQQSRKFDVVAPAESVSAEDGRLVIAGTDVDITEDGVTETAGVYRPTVVCDEGIADKLGVPVQYLKRCRAENPALYDANVNLWLERDDRSFLVRCFRGDGGEGVARAFLSGRYRTIDNLDVLTAALDGVRQAGVTISFDGCDLTERRMYARVVAPEVSALAPALLANYRSPHSGNSGADNPTVFAGLVISNSETGGGAFTIVPRLVVQVCSNGMTMTKDATRHVHLGGKLDEGVVRWSEDTQRRNLELVAAQARDAVATFLDVDYVTAKLTEIEWLAGRKLEEPAKAVETVTAALKFPEAYRQSVLDCFIRSGDATAGGVMQAVTAFAQTIVDADEAYDVEAAGMRALEMAAAL